VCFISSGNYYGTPFVNEEDKSDRQRNKKEKKIDFMV
jgi:hypothetical protein